LYPGSYSASADRGRAGRFALPSIPDEDLAPIVAYMKKAF
jgi:hypothetical protein